MPHPHFQAPHVHSARLPWMGLPRAPASAWEGETNGQQLGSRILVLGAWSPPISDLAPAWAFAP